MRRLSPAILKRLAAGDDQTVGIPIGDCLKKKSHNNLDDKLGQYYSLFEVTCSCTMLRRLVKKSPMVLKRGIIGKIKIQSTFGLLG